MPRDGETDRSENIINDLIEILRAQSSWVFQIMPPRPSLTSLRVFAAVGQCLSFTHAAQRLGVTQSAVSRQVQQLQSTMDVELFRRVGNKIELTKSGHELYNRLEQAFHLIDEAVDAVRNSAPRQKLTLLAPPTFAARWLSRRLVSFRQRFPDLDLSLYLKEDGDVRFDCVIRFGTHPRERYSSVQLMVEQHVAVCSPELWTDPMRMEKSCLLYVLDRSQRLPTWDNWFALARISRNELPKNEIEFSTLDMVIQAAVAGTGLAVIDRRMIELELATGSLVQINPSIVTGPYSYWLDISTERLTHTRTVHFIRWLQQIANGS